MNAMLLTAIVLVPLVLAPLAWGGGMLWPRAPRWIALAGAATQAGLIVAMAPAGIQHGARIVAAYSGDGGFWSLATDGLSTPLVALTAFTGLVAALASWRLDDRPGSHFALLLVLQSAVSAVFLAENLVLFYVAWELVLVPMFLLIGGWGSGDARRASMKFLVYTFAGGAVLLVGVILVAATSSSLSIADLSAHGVTKGLQTLVFWLMAIGFLVKVPAVPLHTWLPDAHTEAPTAGSIVLAGVLLKMGGYGLIRVALPFAPHAYQSARPALAALGLLGIVWGAATALVQTDLKRLVAYSSVAHMGFVLLAVSVGTTPALSAALLVMVSHGFVASMLFFLVGALYSRTHTREMSRFGGLGAVAPGWAALFVFASLASAGLPGLSGFPGEFVASLEAWHAWGWWTLLLCLGLALAAAYNLRAVRETVQGPVGEFSELPSLTADEIVALALFSIAIVVLGIAPWIVSSPASHALAAIVKLTGGGL